MSETREEQMERAVSDLKGEIKALEAKREEFYSERDELEEGLKEALETEMREVVAFARKQGHTWVDMQPFFSGPPENYNDEQLVEWLVDALSAKELARFSRDAESIEGKIRAKRKELRLEKKSLANFREMLSYD
jgi:chromosome segregation ATPase